MAIMCFLAIAIAYVMRVCLSVAITEMVVKNTAPKKAEEGYSMCPADPSTPANPSSPVNLVIILVFIQALKTKALKSMVDVTIHQNQEQKQFNMKYASTYNFHIYSLDKEVYMNGLNKYKDGFCHHSTLDMYLLTFLEVLLPNDMVANGHYHWAFCQQPFSQYSHQSPSNLVSTMQMKLKNIDSSEEKKKRKFPDVFMTEDEYVLSLENS